MGGILVAVIVLAKCVHESEQAHKQEESLVGKLHLAQMNISIKILISVRCVGINARDV